MTAEKALDIPRGLFFIKGNGKVKDKLHLFNHKKGGLLSDPSLKPGGLEFHNKKLFARLIDCRYL